MSSAALAVVALAAAAVLGLAAAGWLVRAVLQEYGRDRVPCLLYHQLQPPPQGGDPGDADPVYVCYADRFAAQMEHLSRSGYTTLSLDEFMRARRSRGLPARPVLVTFDDGFASVYEHAFPVLKRHRQRATIFMTPDRDSPNFRFYAHRDRPLTDDQLHELQAGGVDIESHGLTHRSLPDLDDRELRDELEESRARLEATTGRRVRYLAIPGGAYDGRVKRMARIAGYEAVFCMRKGSAGLDGDPLALPRMVVARDMTLEEFRSLLTPRGWLRGRIISIPQTAVVRVLGIRGANRLRGWLYASPLRGLLAPRRLAWLIFGGLLAGILLLAGLALRSIRW
jgi:peptidoglycan/xylan/chitin deacetylase (PgdA/CDA1 family)